MDDINNKLYEDWKAQVIRNDELETMLNGIMVDFDGVFTAYTRLKRRFLEEVDTPELSTPGKNQD